MTTDVWEEVSVNVTFHGKVATTPLDISMSGNDDMAVMNPIPKGRSDHSFS